MFGLKPPRHISTLPMAEGRAPQAPVRLAVRAEIEASCSGICSFVDWIVKPINRQHLIASIEKAAA